MKNSKPLIREAFKVAAKDMLPILNEKRKEKERLFDESWVVGVSDLDCVEIRRLNAELGLNTLEGTNQWYNI